MRKKNSRVVGKKKKPVNSRKSSIKKSSTKKNRVQSRYNKIQKLLSSYCKANDKHLGSKFNYYASRINKGTLNEPLDQVESNFDVIYGIYVEPIKKVFPDYFPFYEFSDKLISDPVFEGVEINVDFVDEDEEYELKGNSDEVLDEFRFGLYKYLRDNYNVSPVAMFRIVSTDDVTFVHYNVFVTEELKKKVKEEAEKVKEAPEVKEEVKEPLKVSEVDQELALKQKQIELEQKQIELEKEKQKTISDKLKAIKELKDLGFSNDDIMKLIG